MATVKINLSGLEAALRQVVQAVSDGEQTIRPVAIELKDLMQKRIHEDGLASDGSRIGTYKSSYLRYRENAFGRRGTNVILVLTNKMFTSWTVFATDRGWAVGFSDVSDDDNVSSLDKLRFAEENFGKKIGDMTDDEMKYVDLRTRQIVDEIIKQYA